MVALNFNAAGVKPNVALEAIPSGIYPVTITKSEEKPTKKGDGSYIELEMTIMQGHELAGRKVFDRLNIKNPNPTAVEIAYSTLSAICHVTGRMSIQQTEQLHGAPFQVVVLKKPRDDDSHLPIENQRLTNEVKGYKDMNGNDPGAAGNVAQPAAQPNWAQQPPQQPPQQQALVQQPVQQAPQQQAPVDPQQPNWATQPVQQPVQQQPVQQPVQQAPAQQQAPAGQQPPWAQ